MPSGQDFLNQLADIRQRQGKEPIDGTRIEGFESGQPPPPPMPDFTAQRLAEAEPRPDFEDFADSYDVPEDLPPLVRVARPPAVATVVAEAELMVIGESATYRQRNVSLTDQEKAGIVTIVLRALRRSLDEQYQEIAGRPMRRTREKPETKPKRKRVPRAGSAEMGVAE